MAPFALALLLACGSTTTKSARESAVDVFQPYPPGAWRLARHELADVMLTVSHILIVHDDSRSGEQSELRAPGWFAERSVKRARAQARELAGTVARAAGGKPEDFAKLAREYSDDLVTYVRGGSLGTVSAARLPPQFLDALAAMKPDEVSRVVETPLGFHVLKRRTAPSEMEVAARRILISYRTTAPFLRRTPLEPSRSRDEAGTLAQQLSKEARTDPGRFEQLLAQYSDHVDVLRGGDIGAWSNLAADDWHREAELLTTLRAGEVSEPIDSPEGFNIFLRTEATPRLELAFAFLDVKRTRRTRSASAAAAVADNELPPDVSRLIQAGVGSFEALQAKYCCIRPVQWRQGRGDPRVEQFVPTLQIGQFTRKPFDVGAGVVRIVKRLEPTAPEQGKSSRSELPHPDRPDVDYLVSHAKGKDIVTFLSTLHGTLGPGFGVALESDEELRFTDIISGLEQKLRVTPDEKRMAIVSDARSELELLLGKRRYADMQANVRSALAQKLIEH